MGHDYSEATSSGDESSAPRDVNAASEIDVLAVCATKLSALPRESAHRALSYLNDMFGYAARSERSESGGDSSPRPGRASERFADFAELFDAANPTDGLDRVLIGAYWHQVIQGSDDFESQSVNTDLKNLGHPSTNITRDLDNLMNRVPRPVMQVRKSGPSQQARKRYKLTREGVRAAEEMIARTQNG